jgi:hypothetical protein
MQVVPMMYLPEMQDVQLVEELKQAAHVELQDEHDDSIFMLGV